MDTHPKHIFTCYDPYERTVMREQDGKMTVDLFPPPCPLRREMEPIPYIYVNGAQSIVKTDCATSVTTLGVPVMIHPGNYYYLVPAKGTIAKIHFPVGTQIYRKPCNDYALSNDD